MAADPLTDASPFRFSLRPDRSRMFIAPEGELDISSAAAVSDEVEGLWARGFTEVVLDLRDVTFMDSIGLAAVLHARSRLRPGGRLALVVAPDSYAQLVLEIAGMPRALAIFADRDAAIAHVHS